MSEIRHMPEFIRPDVMGAGTDNYGILIKEHRLKVLTTDEELDTALAVAGPLSKAYDLLDESGKDYLRVLSLLIQEYENKHHKIDTDDLDPVDALKFLMEEHDLNQSDIARILDSERGLVSEILSGKKSISKAKAVILAKHFNTDVGMFIKGAQGAAKNFMIDLQDTIPYLLADDTRVVSEPPKIAMGGKDKKPRTTPAKKKKTKRA